MGSCWLRPSVSATPLFWMVAEGGGRRNVGRSGYNGFVMRFVMRLQRNTNGNIMDNKSVCSLFSDPATPGFRRSVGTFQVGPSSNSHEDYKQELFGTLVLQLFSLPPPAVSVQAECPLFTSFYPIQSRQQ